MIDSIFGSVHDPGVGMEFWVALEKHSCYGEACSLAGGIVVEMHLFILEVSFGLGVEVGCCCGFWCITQWQGRKLGGLLCVGHARAGSVAWDWMR